MNGSQDAGAARRDVRSKQICEGLCASRRRSMLRIARRPDACESDQTNISCDRVTREIYPIRIPLRPVISSSTKVALLLLRVRLTPARQKVELTASFLLMRARSKKCEWCSKSLCAFARNLPNQNLQILKQKCHLSHYVLSL